METYLTAQNEWIRLKGHKAFVGLDSRAVKGDVVFIELPAVGLNVQKGQPCATVESIKAVSDVYTPICGVISAVNDSVYDDPDIIAKEDTWLFAVDFEGEPDRSGWTIKK